MHAPAISSILSPEYLAEFAINQYKFDQKVTCRILKIGINHTYLITTSDKKFVLRVYHLNWRTQNEIEEELRVLNYLKTHAFSVSYPIKGKNDNFIQSIKAFEGKRFAVLFSFAEGESIRNPSEEICYKLGLRMAEFHQLTVHKTVNRKNYDANTLVNRAFQSAKDHFSKSTKEMEYFKRANAIISSEFKNADADTLRYGIVHLDLCYDNMKINNSAEITFFDFDNCGNGPLFLDIAYTLMLLFRNEPNKEDFKKKSDRFYEGYESVTSISKEEKRLVPYGGLAIWLHYNGIHIERFNDFSNQFLNEEFLKYWIHTVNLWMEFNQVKI